MRFIQLVIFLLIAVGHVSSDIESNKTMQPQNTSPAISNAFHYAKAALQSLFAKLMEFVKQIQSLFSSVVPGSETPVNAQELRLVAAVWRHGSRAPVTNILRFPDDQIAEHWPRGLGKLTTKGIQEQHLLGEFLRKRYKEFMTNYSSETIYVRSSDSNRAITSGLVTISGFISRTALPTSDDIFSVNQTIPVYTTPLEYDSNSSCSVVSGVLTGTPLTDIADDKTRAVPKPNLFKEIADRFMKKAKEGKASKLQFLGYSTHDMTLLALLADWGVSKPSLYPGYSSCIMVELHERDSDHYVEIWYKPGHGKKQVQLKVKDCEEPCKLQEFVAIAEKFASVNVTADCEKFKEQGLKFVNQKLT